MPVGYSVNHFLCDDKKINFNFQNNNDIRLTETIKLINLYFNNETNTLLKFNNIVYPLPKIDISKNYNNVILQCIWILDVSNKFFNTYKEYHNKQKVIFLNNCCNRTTQFITDILCQYVFEIDSNLLDLISKKTKNNMYYNYFKMCSIKNSNILSEDTKSSCANIEIMNRYTLFLEKIINKKLNIKNIYLSFVNCQKLLNFPKIERDTKKHYFSLNSSEKKVVYGKSCNKR